MSVTEDRRKCPMCAEEISVEALICPRCQTHFVDAQAQRREMSKLAWVIIGTLAFVVALAFWAWHAAYTP